MTSIKSRRALIEKRIIIKQELLRRVNRKRQQARGGLFEFVKYFWPILEPKTKFVDGWAIRAICQHLEAVTDGNITRLLINVPPGFSKPVWEEELVMTSRGRVRLADIAVGDLVLTHKGRYRPVLAVHHQGELPLAKVTAFSGRTAVTALDHPFLTPRGWVQVKDLVDGDCLAYVASGADVSVESEVTPEEARLLGYLVGDGCVKYAQPTFTNMDSDVLDDAEACCTSLGFFTRRRVKLGCRAYSVILRASPTSWNSVKNGTSPLKAWIEKHGLTGTTSYTKRVPAAILRAPNHIVAEFLGAYWSCDGCMYREPKRKDVRASATTVGYGLATDIQHLLYRLGVRARVRRHVVNLKSKKQGDQYVSWHIGIESQHDAWLLRERVPMKHSQKRVALSDIGPIDFERTLYPDELVSVEDAGVGVCRCLTVREDESFTVGDLIVHNSLICNVFWPAWEWGPKGLSSLRTISFSYGSHLTERDNGKFRDIIQSKMYRDLWGDSFKATGVGVVKVSNDKTGWKFASSVGGVGTGERADRCVADDLHNLADGESDVIRVKTVRWFDEAMSNRLNDLQKSAIVVIMQRVNELDVSGHIIENEDNYVHLLIPMEFDGRVCQTFLGRDEKGRRIVWEDPRTEIGELAWPERYGEDALVRFRRNAFMWAGQYQQTPEPRGGGLFKRDWWQYIHVPIGAPPPPMEYVVASLDSAYTKNERNDPSGFTVWGAYVDERDNPKIMMLGAWRKHLEIHGADVEREPGEHELDYKARAKKEWGLVEWVAHECKRHHVDMLLIEAKASGIDVGNEMRRLYANEGWGVELIDPKGGDKYARAVAQIHLFADGMVGVPVSHRNPKDRESELIPRDWAQLVIDETAMFPNGRFKDLTDSTTQALKHLRQVGFAIRRDERDQVRAIQAQHGTTRLDPLYEV